MMKSEKFAITRIYVPAKRRATLDHLIGQTLDGQRTWDVRRGLAVLRTVGDLKGAPLWLQGKGDMAGLVLYAGLFEPDVARFDLWSPPASHRQGPTFLNVRRVLDMPQAVALAFPRSVRLYVKGLQEGHIHDLAAAGVRSGDGAPLLHPQAYYTLNYVPKK